ncbi:VOC family protein [Geodermatophilus sp. SYSU D00691]
MGLGLSRIKHVKLPVTDLRRSAAWYAELFDLELVTEYAEAGEVRGVALYDPDSGIEIDLRRREFCAGRPDLAGFDVFALSAPAEEALAAVVERCDRLGVAHTEVWRFPGFGAGMDIPDPDGIPVRVVWHDPDGPLGRHDFLGVEPGADGRPQTYQQPRLNLERPGADADIPGTPRRAPAG